MVGTGRKRVLVADDEEQVRRLVCRMLEDMGCEADTACDGAEALEKIAACRPDLVLLDVMMPRIDGFGVLKALRQTPDPPPVIGLTAVSDYETFSGFVRGGAAAYLCKPFRFQDLLETCDRVLQASGQARPVVSEERRKEVRRDLMVGVKVLSQGQSPVALGEMVNLSPGGAQVELVVPLELGSLVRVALHVSSKTAVTFEGRVQWQASATHGFTHGVTFVNVTPDVAQRLRDLFRPTP